MKKNILNARNEHIKLNAFDCDYISFGEGDDPLIMLPGVGDGFKTARGVAVPFTLMYRCFAENFKVYVFSRRNNMPEGFTTADMADDLKLIMDAIGIDTADIFGVSQGGMIAQQMAIRYPEKVNSLILAVTASRPNDLLRESLESWLNMADRDDYKGIMLDTAERSYTGAYLKRGRIMNKFLGIMKPKDYTRFRILCKSCLEHDVYNDLDKITCPVWIIGADQDRVLGGEASLEMKEKIPDSRIYIYKGYSHGVYEQAKDFNDRVLGYLMSRKKERQIRFSEKPVKSMGMTEKIYRTEKGEIHYWVSGEAACDANLVFLPGLTADHRLFDKQIEHFEGKYRMFVWNAPGHASSYPFQMDFSLKDKAKWLNEILELEGMKEPVIIGQSMGGYVGQMYAQLFPEKLRGFISIDSAPLQRRYLSGAELWILKRMEPVYRHYPWKLLLKQGTEGVAVSEYGRTLMRSMMMSYDGEQKRYAKLAGHGYRMLADAIEADLPYEIKCPALLICGEKDHAGSCIRYNKKWHRISGIPIVWIRNAGHNSNTDKPEQINHLIESFVNKI